MVSVDFIMFQYQCSSIIIRMMLCIAPWLFLILHVASPLYCICLFFSRYFPAIVISSLLSIALNQFLIINSDETVLPPENFWISGLKHMVFKVRGTLPIVFFLLMLPLVIAQFYTIRILSHLQ